jgi:hypothetical protein
LLTKSATYFYDDAAIREPAVGLDASRNKRSVWTITPKPYKDAHFAVMPAELAGVCIKAGTSERGSCGTCGAPWERLVEGGLEVGWSPPCNCEGGAVPCIVLDPFAGSGTTLQVAKDMDRDFIGIELNDKYRPLIDARVTSAVTAAAERDVFRAMSAIKDDATPD